MRYFTILLVLFVLTCYGQNQEGGFVQRHKKCSCTGSDQDISRGWKPACASVQWYYARWRCSWYRWCYRRLSRKKYYCCSSHILDGNRCILPTTTTSTTTPMTTTEDRNGVADPNSSVADDVTTVAAERRQCGLSKYSDAGYQRLTQIVGGRTSRPNEFPWQVSIRKGSFRGSYHFCGGSIISERLVVTAAHCAAVLSRVPGYPQYAVVGDHDRRTLPSNGEYRINDVIIHPNYQSSTIRNDIALLVLERPINLSANVQKICLPMTARSEAFDNQPVIVSGWGKTTQYGHTSQVLMYAGLSVLPHAECTRIRAFGSLPSTMLCASDNSGSTQKDSCQGDSGGPLFYRNNAQDGTFELVGIVSWGYGCASGYPGVYTRVNQYVDWINSQIRKYP